jgi:hypothetical protein
MSDINVLLKSAIEFATEAKEAGLKKKLSEKETEELMKKKFEEVEVKKNFEKAKMIGKLEALREITEKMM